MQTFKIEAEYANTVIGRRALIPLGEGQIPVTIESTTLDPDTSEIVIMASVPMATIPLRFAATDVLEIEQLTEAVAR